ncbi:hypothetical protein QVD17_37374 [Tagetes erecta]|uniref:Uncharacterized protein n=1 Tax=Tagetes erecta TaxID=13708 RepID=A0AAD8JVX0_TARER|nr:hypothetical protein QVD17_37374 [Tagetes erecta]
MGSSPVVILSTETFCTLRVDMSDHDVEIADLLKGKKSPSSPVYKQLITTNAGIKTQNMDYSRMYLKLKSIKSGT